MEWAWIGIAGVVVWGAIGIIYAIRAPHKNDDLTKALEENAAVNKALLAKLETIDTRLGTVEKTLTDIQ